MRTVDKALTLLDYFSDRRPAIGLSELARLAGMDKATVHRMATALANHGFLEQDPVTKSYRLGAGILRLARLREACFPVEAIIEPILKALSEETGETAHASLLAGMKLATVGVAEPQRANRVFIEPGLLLPFHATASGFAVLAFSRAELIDAVLSKPLPAFTEKTVLDPRTVRARIADCAARGYSISDGGYESDVCSTAAPLFDAQANVSGAVTVAAPASRMNDSVRQSIAVAVIRAAGEITRALGGQQSPGFRSAVEQVAA